ncbi:sensor histidine kinase [Hymenobacter lucidus]|uniref:histidine kinase n=1 Tax=Hymenobacter lucidus TaxID=2880930 RepID=A0ABS8AYD5_9BACT|nr:ATP-binding protein [Hymenobacter lucidus]MCB2410827.1 cell wall metabolism sensor histidine kinase WalK [Hymenobacter lucidus]
MNLKSKITAGFLLMLVLLAGIGAYAFSTVRSLDYGSRAILQDNFYSVQLGQAMLQALDAAEATPAGHDELARFRRYLRQEAANVTERGEQQLVDSMLLATGRYQAETIPTRRTAAIARLRRQTHRMVALNMQALTRKNEQANRAASASGRYLLALLTLGSLAALGLVFSVPEAAVGGLHKLTTSIDHAARGNFAASIPVESTDEFGRVARSFNQLLVHLNDFRSANLAELLTERNRVTSIVQTLDEGLLLLDENRRIIVANPVACTLLALPEKQLVGRRAADVAAHNPRFGELLAYLQLPAAQRAVEPLTLTITQGAEPAHYRLAVHEAVSFNAATDRMEFVGTILALHNVSEFRKLDQAKSDFLATVSHELKTPLSSISFHLKLLQDARVGPINEEQSRIVATLKNENERLRKLATGLLDVSRLEAGGIPLNPQPTAVAALVEYAAAPIRLQLAPRQLRLAIELPENLPAVRADLEKTAWVLLNLLANAVRYSPEQGCITVSAATTPDGRAVQLRVQDAGPGIAPENQQQIFERFVQLPGPDQAAPTGSAGLGLSISREFITSQGGQLGVESTPGAGSTFFFTLPVAGAAA